MKTETIDYYNDGEVFEGYFAHRENSEEKLPCMLVCHAWGGQSIYERELAEKMADLGYLGFAIDIYGKGKRGDPFQGNEHLMNPFLEDRARLKSNLLAALTAAKNHPKADPARIGAIGLCFGGLCALDLARSATEGVLGVASFHGVFDPPGLPQEQIKTKILILHGFEDPVAPPDKMLGIAGELTEAGADWQMHVYGHTKHAFTVPQANLPEAGIMYNELSAGRSWDAMVSFFQEVFQAYSR